jgi:hypothetical protein
MSTNNTQFFTSNTTTTVSTPASKPTPAPPQHSIAERVSDGAKRAAIGAYNAGATVYNAGANVVGTLLNPGGIVEGLGSKIVKGVKKELPPVPTAAQVQKLVEEALLREPSKELLQLKVLIRKAIDQAEDLTPEDTQFIDAQLKTLLKDNEKLLKQLDPKISPEELKLFKRIEGLFKDPSEDPDVEPMSSLEQDVQDLKKFDAALTAILDKNQGALIRILAVLQEFLLAENDGLCNRAVDILKKKLSEEDGVFKIIETKLTDEEHGILIKAVHFIEKKMMGTFDRVVERMTEEAHPLLSDARKKIKVLRKAITDNKKGTIQKSSRELQQLLEQIVSTEGVFRKEPLSEEHKLLLTQLKDQLSSFYAENPQNLPSQKEMLSSVDTGISTINRYYAIEEGHMARTFTVFQENLANTVTETITNAFQPMKEMVEGLLGKPSTESTTPQDGSAPPAEEGTVSQFLANGSSILKTILDKGAKAISSQAISSFASVLILGIEDVLTKMGPPTSTLMGPPPERDPFQAPRATLLGIISALTAAQSNGGSWAGIYQNLKDAAKALSSVKIYVNGFRIPNMGLTATRVATADGAYSENINTLQDAMDLTPEQPVNQDWRKLAGDEKNKLIANASRFLTIKHIYEGVCKLKPADEVFYLTLMKKAKDKNGRTDDVLRDLLFEELEKSKVNFFTRAYAKVQYYLYNKIVRHYTKKATTVYFNEIFDYIDKHKKEQFTGLRNQVTKNFTRYLTILGGAYENVANDPKPTGTLQEMVRKELDTKESNQGFETKELYMEFAQNVIKKTVGSGFLGWVAKHLIGDPESMVQTVIDKSIGSMQDVRGYTHAMNSVMHEQLDEILKLLRKELRGVQANPGPQQPNEEGELDSELKELSHVEKKELNALVKNLFEILRKSKCQTKDELRDLIKGNLLSAKVNKAIDDLFIEEVIEKVTNILVAAIESLAKRHQLEKLTYKFANLVNRSFELGETVTLQEMQEEEHQIVKLGGQILRLAVGSAVEEKFDFSGKKEQDASKRYLDDLHQRSQEFLTATEQDLQALTTMDFNSAQGKNKINKIVEQTLAYEAQNYDSSFQAKSSTLSSDNKDEIEKGYLGIAEQSKPVVQAITQMKQHLTSLENVGLVTPHLKQIKASATTVPLKLFPAAVGPTDEDLTFAENQLAILDTHLKELKKMRHYSQLSEQIAAEARTFAAILIEAKKSAKTRRFSIAQAQNGSQIDQIAHQRKQSLAPIPANSPLRNQLAAFKQEISNHFDDTYRPRLLMAIKNIEDATVPQQVDFARQEFLSICRQALTQATTALNTQRGNYYLSFQRMSNAIDASHLLDPNHAEAAKTGIRNAIAASQQNLQTLRQWEGSNIRGIPYINFNPVDMKGIQDWASGLVYDRVRERLNGFMHFLKQEETYRFGLLNHLFLVPYLKNSK